MNMKQYIVLLLAAVSLIGCAVEEPEKPLCPGNDEVYCKGVCLRFDVNNVESCDNDDLICKSEFGDCDSKIGCEQKLNDNDHCGGCGVKCNSNEFCSKGICESKCSGTCSSFQYCSEDGKCVNNSCDTDHPICGEGYGCLNGRCYKEPFFDQLEICDDNGVRDFINSADSLKIMQSVYGMNNPHQVCSKYHELIDYFIKNGAGLCSKTRGCLDPKDLVSCIYTLSDSALAGVVDVSFVARMIQINSGACVKNSCWMNDSNSICRLEYECNMGYCKSGDDYQVCHDYYISIEEYDRDQIISKYVEMLTASDEEICTKYKELVRSLSSKCPVDKGKNCLVAEDTVILCGEGLLREYQQTERGSEVTDEMIERFVEINASCWE